MQIVLNAKLQRWKYNNASSKPHTLMLKYPTYLCMWKMKTLPTLMCYFLVSKGGQ